VIEARVRLDGADTEDTGPVRLPAAVGFRTTALVRFTKVS